MPGPLWGHVAVDRQSPCLELPPHWSAFGGAQTPWRCGLTSTHWEGEASPGSSVHLATSGSVVSLFSAVPGPLTLTLEPSVGCPAGSPGSAPPGSQGPTCGLAFWSPGLSAGRGPRSDPLESAATRRPASPLLRARCWPHRQQAGRRSRCRGCHRSSGKPLQGFKGGLEVRFEYPKSQ